MNNPSFSFWQKWLTWANVMALFVGLIVAFAGNTFLFDLYHGYSEDVFFGGAPFPEDALRLQSWLFGVVGGSIVGFQLLMILISEIPFKRKERWAYWAMWAGLLSWFVIDSSITVYYGAIHNLVIINLPALLLIGLPLVMTRREFGIK